jgi:hypothetical protein
MWRGVRGDNSVYIISRRCADKIHSSLRARELLKRNYTAAIHSWRGKIHHSAADEYFIMISLFERRKTLRGVDNIVCGKK